MHSFTFSLSFCANLGTVRQEARLTVPSGRKLSKQAAAGLTSGAAFKRENAVPCQSEAGIFQQTGHVA